MAVTHDHHAEFMRTLSCTLRLPIWKNGAMKAARSKDATAEFSKNYETAVENLHTAGRALKAITDKLDPAKHYTK